MNQSIGCDYGIRPLVQIVGDTRFIEYMGQNLQGLGYTQIDGFGVLVDPPVLAFIFNNQDNARKAFETLKGWTDDSEDGDAVGIGFVEMDDGSYRMCVYPEHERLLNRCIPEYLRNEVKPLLLTPTYVKSLDKQSDYYRWFKSVATRYPFVVLPATIDGGPLFDLGFRKRQVNFYQEGNVPENAFEIAAIASQQSDSQEGEVPNQLKSRSLQPDEIKERRRSQLTRFFPVTLERLAFSRTFQETKKRLLELGYLEWQIDQAACNLVFKHRAPHLFQTDDNPETTGSSPQMRILEFVLNHVETVTGTLPEREIELSRIIEQIHSDSRELLKHINPDKQILDEMLQDELKAHELLEE